MNVNQVSRHIGDWVKIEEEILGIHKVLMIIPF